MQEDETIAETDDELEWLSEEDFPLQESILLPYEEEYGYYLDDDDIEF